MPSARRPGWTPTRRRPASPWRVALPAYGSRVAWDDEAGSQRSKASNALCLRTLGGAAPPHGGVSRIEDRRPPGLAGIVWFRLPTRVDARAWSLPTWRAALARQPLRPALSVSAAAAGGARDLILANAGDAAALRFAVRLDGACAAADGINGYTLERDGLGIYLRRAQEGLLHAGANATSAGYAVNTNRPTSMSNPKKLAKALLFAGLIGAGVVVPAAPTSPRNCWTTAAARCTPRRPTRSATRRRG